MYFFQIFPNFCVEFYAKIIKNSTNVFNLMLDRWRSQANSDWVIVSQKQSDIANQTTAIFVSIGHFF